VVEGYFSPDSFQYINLQDINAAVTRVTDLVKRDIWAERYPAIRASRERLLQEHNLFAVCERYINSHEASAQPPLSRPVKIKPIYSANYRKFREIRKRVRGRLRRSFPYGIF
jgi:hypothetical protein